MELHVFKTIWQTMSEGRSGTIVESSMILTLIASELLASAQLYGVNVLGRLL
jgi:hypothetical protein